MGERKKGMQLKIRGDGKLRSINIIADNLAEATCKTILACHYYGARIETPKQKPGMTLGYDADITVTILNPDSEPKIYSPGLHDTIKGVMQYILEITHGIHNHWKKCPEHPEWWGYIYNERFVDQLPFVFQRIKADWESKKGQWYGGKGRPSGREYQFNTWRPGEDIILEQEDSPCLQRGQIRLLQDKKGDLVLNYLTDWRSRDLLKAWNENIIGQIELMKLFRDKISDMLQVPIKLGSYVDHSSSLHLYGLYIDRDNLEKKIKQMKKEFLGRKRNLDVFFEKPVKDMGYKIKSMSLEKYFGDRTKLKRLIAAQMHAERAGDGLNQPEDELKKLGFDVLNHPYPKEWDSWPSSWDVEPDRSKLARVP